MSDNPLVGKPCAPMWYSPETLLASLERHHESFIKGTGKDPANYSSVYSEAAGFIRFLLKEQAPRSASEALVTVREDVIRFLLGEVSFDGYWFGEKPLNNPMFWWRTPLKLSMHPYTAPSSTTSALTGMSPLCGYHRRGELELPDMSEPDACVACHIAYLEAQEGLLEQAQQRAARAEDAIKDMERPLDAQMARLNAEVVRLNGENELLRARSSTGRAPETPRWTDAAEAAFEKWWQSWREANDYANTQRMRETARAVYVEIAYSPLTAAVENLAAEGNLANCSASVAREEKP